MNNKLTRKNIRLKDFNYNSEGAYFITICTQNKICLLSHIMQTTVLDTPKIHLTKYGEIANKVILQLSDFYNNVSVENFVIMPNHVHLLLFINYSSTTPPETSPQNSIISRFISTFKRFCNKEFGENIWQKRSYDHIIRNTSDFDEHLKYIYENPIRWTSDEFYTE